MSAQGIPDNNYPQSPILLFDGVCNLCNKSVQWVLLHDRQAKFRFAALQSETGQLLLETHGVDKDNLNTVVLIHNGKVHFRSDAVIETARLLGGIWRLFSAFKILPRPLRHALYNFVADNRYHWFGRHDECWLPRPEWKARFL